MSSFKSTTVEEVADDQVSDIEEVVMEEAPKQPKERRRVSFSDFPKTSKSSPTPARMLLDISRRFMIPYAK